MAVLVIKSLSAILLLVVAFSAYATGIVEYEDPIDVAEANGSFTTLLAVIDAAGLESTLRGPGPFAVFAPTDEAFAALPAGTIQSLLGDIPTLSDVLLYHVVAGEVYAEDVVNLTSATTVQGQSIAISVTNGSVFVNDAQVVITDVQASNGVIHVIDRVILPNGD
ncbi:MAG: fasciclin domain-containing protein [Spirochaetota bacterium]